MRMQLCTWPDIEAYLRKNSHVIIPIGSTEQHGPTGLMGTDALSAEAVALRVGEDTESLVAPTLPIGMALHHMGFPGSMTLRPTTLIAVVRDVVLSLAQHGVERFFFVNGHGGNVPTLQAAFFEAYGDAERMQLPNAQRLRCKVVNWWQTPSVVSLAAELCGDAEGVHATPSEIALTWHLFPDLENNDAFLPSVAPNGPIFGPADFRARFPDGRVGSDPSLARREHGLRFFSLAVTDCARMLADFRASH